MKYINDPLIRWFVYLRVPYGTYLWQLGDSNEQNRSYKLFTYNKKHKLFDNKTTIGMDPVIEKSNIVIVTIRAIKKFFYDNRK